MGWACQVSAPGNQEIQKYIYSRPILVIHILIIILILIIIISSHSHSILTSYPSPFTPDLLTLLQSPKARTLLPYPATA